MCVVTKPSVRTKQLQLPALAWQSLPESLPRSQGQSLHHKDLGNLDGEAV